MIPHGFFCPIRNPTFDPSGAISQGLAGYCKRIVGVDVSEGAVSRYNIQVANHGISEDEMHALCLELAGSSEELGGEKFDVIIVSLLPISLALGDDAI
jgi:2-polyprenyl-3-methyl-5-hydroxy-6-metoxy-1,4-benzoquinol methylase